MGQPTTLRSEGVTSEIPMNEWASFMAEFTRDNRGAHGLIEILGAEEVPRVVEFEDQPFDGISADLKDGENTIWIMFGSDPDQRLTHGINNPTTVRVQPPSGSHGPVIEIEAKDGTKTLLQLSLAEEFALPPAP